MSINIPQVVLEQIHTLGLENYPEEGVGLLLGSANGNGRVVQNILRLENSREDDARHNRYLITAQDMLAGEKEAAKQNLDVIGVFHSHPDHPNQPSEFDREWALPWYSYVITSIETGKPTKSRSWRLTDDRKKFVEEIIEIKN